MATSGDNHDVDDVMTCPVCTERYTDPRLLECGHYFCLTCLEKIASGHPAGHVTCPTCRYLTNVTAVTNLNKYKLNEFQIKVTAYLSQSRIKVGKLCALCETYATASACCYECKITLCEKCKVEHSQFGNHKVCKISPEDFCKYHPSRFVQFYCKTCVMGFCPLCSLVHTSHDFQDVCRAAEDARETLRTKVIAKVTLDDDRKFADSVDKAQEEVGNRRVYFTSVIAAIKEQIFLLQDNLKVLERETEVCVDAEAKDLSILKSDITEFIKTKENLINDITELVNNSSDAEVISRARDFPKYATDSLYSVVNKKAFLLPEIDHIIKYQRLIQEMNKTLSLVTMERDILDKDANLGKTNNSLSGEDKL